MVLNSGAAAYQSIQSFLAGVTSPLVNLQHRSLPESQGQAWQTGEASRDKQQHKRNSTNPTCPWKPGISTKHKQQPIGMDRHEPLISTEVVSIGIQSSPSYKRSRWDRKGPGSTNPDVQYLRTQSMDQPTNATQNQHINQPMKQEPTSE